MATAAKTATTSGAKVVLECLAREKVECIFGYPGGVTLPLYDALYDHPIRHVLVRHEQNACFAAEGYARATGKVGVCCATSGPGADQPGDRPGRRDDGFDPHRRHHRPGLDQADRQRRVSGSRHVRHHALLHQAQFSGEDAGRTAAGDPRSVPHRLDGTSGAGAGRHPQGCLPGAGPLRAGVDDPSAGLQGLHRGPRRPDPARGADDLGSQAALRLRGRRHHRGGMRAKSCGRWWSWWMRRRSAR